MIHLLALIAAGALLGRINGGGLIIGLSRWWSRIGIMGMFVACLWVSASWWATIAALGVLGIATGHGHYLARTVRAYAAEKLDVVVKLFFGKDPRTQGRYAKYEHINHDELLSMFPDDAAKMRDEMEGYGLTKLRIRNIFGMFVTGQLVGLFGCIVCLCLGLWPHAALFALTGAAKAIAYGVTENTEHSEYINGGLRGAICWGLLVV